MQRTNRGSLPCFGLWASLSWILLGCGTDLSAPRPAPDPAQLYWALTLEQRAITLSTVAPYDTLRLVATARAATGDPLPIPTAVVYKSSDLKSLQVGSDGVVRAVAPGNGFQIIATLTMGNLTHADTAQVNVTADP